MTPIGTGADRKSMYQECSYPENLHGKIHPTLLTAYYFTRRITRNNNKNKTPLTFESTLMDHGSPTTVLCCPSVDHFTIGRDFGEFLPGSQAILCLAW